MSLFEGLLEKSKKFDYVQKVSNSRKYGIQIQGQMLLDREGDMPELVKRLRRRLHKYADDIADLEQELANYRKIVGALPK